MVSGITEPWNISRNYKANNVAANSLLENLGFKRHAISSGGAVLVAQGIYDEEGDDFHAFPIERYVMETGKVTMDDGI